MKHKLTIIKDAVPLHLLDLLKNWSLSCEQWGLAYPINYPIEERFLKMNVINNDGNTKEKAIGAGIATAIICMIHQKCKLFDPRILCCGIGVRDKHTKSNIHTDHKHDLSPL